MKLKPQYEEIYSVDTIQDVKRVIEECRERAKRGYNNMEIAKYDVLFLAIHAESWVNEIIEPEEKQSEE